MNTFHSLFFINVPRRLIDEHRIDTAVVTDRQQRQNQGQNRLDPTRPDCMADPGTSTTRTLAFGIARPSGSRTGSGSASGRTSAAATGSSSATRARASTSNVGSSAPDAESRLASTWIWTALGVDRPSPACLNATVATGKSEPPGSCSRGRRAGTQTWPSTQTAGITPLRTTSRRTVSSHRRLSSASACRCRRRCAGAFRFSPFGRASVSLRVLF